MDVWYVLESMAHGLLNMNWMAYAALGCIPVLKGARWLRVRWRGEKWK